MNYMKIINSIVIHSIVFLFIVMFANVCMYIDQYSDEYYVKWFYYVPKFVYVLFSISLIISLFSSIKKK